VATWWPNDLTLPETLYLLCAAPKPVCPGLLEYLDRAPALNRAGLQAAAVAELVLAGRVTLRLEKGASDEIWTDRVWAQVIDATPPGDPVLGVALSTLVGLNGRSKPVNLAGPVLERLFGPEGRSWELVPRCLVGKGILRELPARVWGLLPVTIFPVVARARQKRLRRTFLAAVGSTKRPSNGLAGMISIAESCSAFDKAVTGGLSESRLTAVIERAEANKLGRLLRHMIRVATYEPPEMHAGLLAS
jgi:hypothetical protein